MLTNTCMCISVCKHKYQSLVASLHRLVNHTVDMLAPLGGPVIDGPFANYNDAVCNFPYFSGKVKQLKSRNKNFVIEASKGGCTPDDSCIASYLLAAEEFVYLSKSPASLSSHVFKSLCTLVSSLVACIQTHGVERIKSNVCSARRHRLRQRWSFDPPQRVGASCLSCQLLVTLLDRRFNTDAVACGQTVVLHTTNRLLS